VSQFPISETITALVTGAVAWFFGGRQAEKSSMVDDAKKVLAMWQETNHNCQNELMQMREEIQAVRKAATDERAHFKAEMAKMRKEIDSLQAHIKKLEAK
jgi:peptidoglycan hydrolase CwlO-like protein